MADKHILLTFISPHHFIKDTNILSITSDENGKYYNTLGPSVKKIYKKYHQLDYVTVITSEKTSEDVNIKIGEKEENISPLRLFERFCKEEVDSSIQVESIHFGNEDDFNANVSSVLEAVNFINMQKEDKLYIHIDVTAGFRNASMLLTAITQLLKLNPQIIIKEVLYYEIKGSNIVCHDIKDIYDISKLSAGAEAFVKYGSTEVLEDYFQEKKILNLRPLLNAMKDFAEALQICSAKLLPANIENLKQQITTFEGINFNELNEYERLFSVFLEKIKEKYKKLFAKSGERRSMQLLNIIEWCKENNYIQQEITLATELIPVIIYLEKMFYPAPNTLNAVKREYFDKTYGKKGKNINKKDKRWQTLSEDILASFFIKSYKYDLFKPYEDNQSKNRFSEMINNNDAATSLDNQIANEICYKYLKINEVRNKINHAANEKDIKYVKSILTEMIGRLRRLLKKMNYSNKPEKK